MDWVAHSGTNLVDLNDSVSNNLLLSEAPTCPLLCLPTMALGMAGFLRTIRSLSPQVFSHALIDMMTNVYAEGDLKASLP